MCSNSDSVWVIICIIEQKGDWWRLLFVKVTFSSHGTLPFGEAQQLGPVYSGRNLITYQKFISELKINGMKDTMILCWLALHMSS